MSRVKQILDHIHEDCQDILSFVNGMSEEQFLSNKLVMNAVGMSLINIGELVKALPKELYETYQEIPWKRIAGMRDLVAHKYKSLNMSTVWVVIKDNIPEIEAFIETFEAF